MMNGVIYIENNEDEFDGAEEIFNSTSIVHYVNQVAGHTSDSQHVGMVTCNGKLFKPSYNLIHFKREVQFYECLHRSINGSLYSNDHMIKSVIPQYYGQTILQINDADIPCLILEDLTKGMKEPCIMDVKIGQRTWDPEATLDKIRKEEAKYVETKREYGVSVTGFQVYDVKSGNLHKYDKSYGKQLNKDTIIRVFRHFLNGSDLPINRILLIQLLVNIWRIQHWARKQSQYRLFSSSVLLIYDARRLRQLMKLNPSKTPAEPSPSSLRRSHSLYRPLSLVHLTKDKCAETGFSGQLSKEGPIIPSCIRSINNEPLHNTNSKKKTVTLKRIHSFQNNYDEELRSIRTDYTNILENLSDDDNHSEMSAIARMIDFAHIFPSVHGQIDNNYLHGIDNLCKILEGFLMETE